MKAYLRSKTVLGELLGPFTVLMFMVGFVIFGPLVGLWALNTLFPALAIQYSFINWLAFLSLIAIIDLTVTKR